MKDILKKYKIPLVSSGILLSIIVSSSIINYNISKNNIDMGKERLEAISTAEVKVKSQTIQDGKVLVQADENIEVENIDDTRKQNDIEDPTDKKDKSTHFIEGSNDKSNTKVKEGTKAKSTQTMQTNNNTSAQITGEKYIVEKGDTLFLIAQRANVSTNHLKELNSLSSDIIYENQTLGIQGSVKDSSNQLVNRGSERSDDLYWLSRIIHSEAQGESYEGKVAVGNVIMNRVGSGLFPNTIKGVVFDKQEGYTQFSPVIDGTIYNTPDAESVRAATDVLNGARPVGSALYFLNPRKSTNFWIVNNRKYMMKIGLHDFYY